MTDSGMRPASGAAGIGPGAQVCAVDVGGTSIKGAMLDSRGEPIATRRVASPPRGAQAADAVVALVAEVIADLTAEAGAPASAGITLPGIFDESRGWGIHSENLGWRDVDFRARFADVLDVPTAFAHDVRAAGEAEWRIGAAAGHATAVVITVGTGVSAALIIEGRPYLAGGHAGEMGHAPVPGHREACVCGAQGCLEAVASAAAIVRRFNAATQTARVEGADEVLSFALAGDAWAREVWVSAVNALADSITQVIAVLAPEVIVIGGGLAEAGDELFVPLRTAVAERWALGSVPPIVPARLGATAGMMGAALRARDLVSEDTTP
ncbi:ROK family protein [Demequina sp.]|uniref:ROK family protein n=1 Tax=Demequina sp. TaxID=2050685 RepID=UPI003A869B2F